MIRIYDSMAKTSLKAAVLISTFLLGAAAMAFGQQVNLTAGPTTITMPDGTTVPMWGYTCGAAVTSSTVTCAPLSGSTSAAATGSLGGIYVLDGGSGYSTATPPAVTISAPNSTTGVQATATAVISGGQIVGFNVTSHGSGYTSAPTVTIAAPGSGTQATAAASPAWSPVVITVPWASGGVSLTINLTNNLSFGTGAGQSIPTSIVITGQVGGGLGSSRTTTTSPDHSNAQGCVSWFIAGLPPGVPCASNQSGAMPPSQGNRVQSMAKEVAAGAAGTATATSLTWANLKPGTYLLESGTHPSIQVPMGLIGMLVVTTSPSGTTAGTAYPAVTTPTAASQTPVPAVTYNAEVPLEFSEIDPVQNKAVDQAVRTAGFTETAAWSKMTGDVVAAVTVTNGGSGYTSAPSVSIVAGGGGGSGAAAAASLSFGVGGVAVASGGGGNGYVVNDVLTFTDGDGTGATATVASVGTGGVITSVAVGSAGSGYTVAPTTVTGGKGTGAVLTATLATTGSVGSVSITNGGAGYSSATVSFTGGGGNGAAATATVVLPGCGLAHTCYPPAVNYTPFYYLINGQAFDKTNAGRSLFAATAGTSTTTPVTGTLLVRLVNAGLRMHVPAIVGSQTTGFNGAGASATVSGFTLIAEDGNPVPDSNGTAIAPRVKTEVFMAAGKTYDVMVNVPATTATALPIYARDLALSANSSVRDAGMLAYIGANGAVLPAVGAGIFGSAQANADTYNSVVPCASGSTSCVSVAITDPSKGVIANDVNVYGVELSTPPTNGTLICNAIPGNPTDGICANGTFTYTPNAGATAVSQTAFDTFGYCANGAASPTSGTSPLCTTVTLGVSGLTGGTVTVNDIKFTSNMATFLKIPSPGVLSVDSDSNNLPLQVSLSNVTPSTGLMLNMDSNGGFTASVAAAGTYTFTYKAQNSLGALSSTAATVTLIFPTPSNLKVNVLDAQAYNSCNGNAACISGLTPFSDYRWIIEEDKTFWVDPNCTANSSINTPGCPSVVGPSGQSTIPTSGVQFHTSTMDFVAQGCTGQLSCEGGQTMLDPATGQHVPAVCDVGNGACRPDPTGNGLTPVNPSQVHLDPSKRYYISVLPGDAANPFPANASPAACNGQEATSVLADPNQTQCGHTMSGASIPPACNILGGTNACPAAGTAVAFAPVNVLVLPTPLPTGKLSVLVFEDDYPLNGEQDGGGGAGGAIAPVEPGLGGFNIVLWDTYGGLGDFTGQNSNDMFNQPLSNSLAGTIDPTTGLDACPVSANPLSATGAVTAANGTSTGGLITGNGAGPAPATGMTGMIVTCPKYEADGTTLSPLGGQAVIANLMPEKFSVQAYPGADRIARGEEWIQTNTLDGQHPHDAFIEIGDPSYFQEYGPAGYHVMIGFANPAIINTRHDDVCKGFGTPGTVGPCTNTIKGQVNVERLSRIPDERLYPSESRDALTWTQCWVSLGDPDGEDFEFTKCDANGNFSFTNVPGGNWRLTIGDQWNDQIIDGLSTAANVGCTPNGVPNGTTNASTCPGGQTLDLGHIGVQQWQSNLYTKVCVDDNKNGICDSGEIGIPLIYTMVHYRDGHNANALTTDFNGVANFNETFPLFNWYVVEADDTRYKTTGIHTVYDAGGPADGTTNCGPGNGARPCGTSPSYKFFSNTYESVPLPTDLSVPGAVYCQTADCSKESASFAAGTAIASSGTASTSSTGRIDPPWVWAEGWAGLTGHSNWIEIGKAPYAACNPSLPVSATNFCATVTSTPAGATTPVTTQAAENGGIRGTVVYASTRPFDDASQMIQQPWEPNVPSVTVNLYQEGFASDGVTPTLTMVDTTTTSSWDAWAQGFYPNSAAGSSSGAGQKPYMSCPGQDTATNDLFYFTLFDQPNYLDWYNSVHNGGMLHTLPYNSEFKCYDAMKINNQLQPAPYDGKYFFPSSIGRDPSTGKLVSTIGSTNGVTANMAGTNCTICVPNPDSTDPYRVGAPMLPPGKYVVEVIMPAGYEVYKEEDKNLLIGDNFVAPVTQQFGGLGTDIFIMPDQASVASMYDESGAGYNPTNYQNSTTSSGLADELSGVPGFPGYTDPVWPCVGEKRVVPDYLSEFPQAKETAPFAGATRPLCDRKEVTLTNQMAVNARFFVFTSTHIAAKYTGVITDDFTSEFDPFSPQFGEKFSPPNMPISTKDYLGNELSRVYSDHWGIYDGLTFSSWNVNPPNITGYSPSMMTQCMNDPGPVLDTNPSSKTYGQMITDPLYNPAYSDFCYINPYMPGLTTYNDTPVVPTQAFVGAGYNNPDCSYPEATPAVSEVDGDGIGPWVSQPGKTLTITALGDQQVNNNAYSGPSANAAPFNAKTITRHYGFGSQCTAISGSCVAVSSVTIGGASATVTSWSDTSITVTVPGNVPACTIQQQVQYGNPNTTGAPGQATRCGELLITAGNGKQSIDSVTVTVGGKAPSHVTASQTIQAAIDRAAPGDLIIVDPTCATSTSASTGNACEGTRVGTITGKTPAAHVEALLMWKPVRLQGVGAASSIIDANAFPSGRLLEPWRRHVNCLFGLTLNGVALASSAPYDPTATYSCPDAGWKYYGTDLTGAGSGSPVANVPQVDRVPLEAVLGWDATLNGNLAEQLQEPSLMGAYEGAGITVLGKGVWTPTGQPSFGLEGAFPAGSLLLQNVPAALDETGAPIAQSYDYCTDPKQKKATELVPNPYPSNFECNPSSIDGLTIRDSSQGGGGVFVHGWNHNLQIANNRINNNAGTLSGGITLGQGEFPDPITVSGVLNGVGEETSLDVLPSCQDSAVVGTHLPYCLDLNVNMHNNAITSNSSLGDELFSGTLAGGGGASFCTGSDYYKFNYNWVCGNVSSAEGGGITHLGFNYNGDIEHNTIALNESSNPTVPTNGGGIMIMGTPDTDPVCTGIPDADCPPGLSDGTGPNLVVNANLIQANAADSGAGGGIRLQQVNGTEVSSFPKQPQYWNSAWLTNNIIVNNMAGWDGAGISLQDALNVTIQNNTISSNDTLATSGVLTQSIGTPVASAPAGTCVQTGPAGTTQASCPQPSGVSSTPNSSVLTTTLVGPAATITCPSGMSGCKAFSNPLLENNVIWQNRSFYIGVGNPNPGLTNQQNQVTLFEAFTSTAAPAQSAFGQCGSASYWDVGVRGDRTVTGHESGFKLNPTYSVLDDTGYASSNQTSNPGFVSQYCNGGRVPPTCTVADGCGGPSGYGVPPGIVDASAPNPVFSLTPAATVDEGNNWINVSWGPLALSDDSITGGMNGNYGGGNLFGNYALTAAIDDIPATQPHPTTDFFGNPRPDPNNATAFDPGAVEFEGALPGPPTLISITPTSGYRGTSVNVTITGTSFTASTSVAVSGGVTVSSVAVTSPTTITATFAIPHTATLGGQTVTITTAGGTAASAGAFTVLGTSLTSINPTSGVRGSTVPVTLTGAGLEDATAVVMSGTGIGCTLSGTPTGTTVNASCTIAGSAGLTARSVTVDSPDGNVTLAGAFTVTAPTAASISPSTGVRGTTQPVTITGANLQDATGVTMSGAGVTCTLSGTPTATTVNASCVIAASAGLTARTVTVVDATNGNATVTGTFRITAGTAAFSAPSRAMNSGGTSTKSATITLSNTATGVTAGPITLTANPTLGTKGGTGNGTFSIQPGGTCVSGFAINPGSSCTINVQYSGETNAANATDTVSITGSGIGNNTTGTVTSASFIAN